MNIVKRIYRKRVIDCVVVGANDTHEQIKKLCDKCDGKGVLEHYAHIDKGVCFKCGGSGLNDKIYSIKKIDNLTQEIQKLQAEQDVKEQKAKDEWRDKAKETSLKECRKQLKVFNNTDTVYIVVEKNTYSIKDELKSMGAKWGGTLKRWYFENKPETQYKLKEVNIYDCIYLTDNTNPEVVNTWNVAWGSTYQAFEIYQD